jgi:MYXO-CTERM domain-containing protein
MKRSHRVARARTLGATGAVAVLTVVVAAAGAAPTSTSSASAPARSFARDGAAGAWAIGGVLSAPSTAPADRVALRYLAADRAALGGVDLAALAVDRVVALRRGSLVRLRQRHRSLPVVGGDIAVRVDESGRVRWVAARARPVPADLEVRPAISAAAAVAAAGAAARYPAALLAGVDPARAADLVVLARRLGPARLAWRVMLPTDLARRQTVRAFVDARTGAVVARENLLASGVASPLANVYETNPIETPELAVVSLDTLADGSAGLANLDVNVRGCIDDRTCVDTFGSPMHWCEIRQGAVVDGDGNFTGYTFASDTDPDDAFAEVQAFYHAAKVYATARAMGVPALSSQPINILVNFRFPDFNETTGCEGTVYTGNGMLLPFDNAFFTPDGNAFLGDLGGAALVFGQGTAADFAYDGDVVYHEFGHAVMYDIAPELGRGGVDQYGFNSMQGGMHEGYADLFTMFVTDDPEVGEYAGVNFLASEEIRNLDNTATCPAGLTGEAHYDSLPITGAIWEARTLVATTPVARTAFDGAVFAAQHAFGADDDFETAAAMTVLELDTALGADAAAMAQEVFERRGLYGCNDRVTDATLTHAELYLAPNNEGGDEGVMPGPVQFAYDLDAPATELRFDAEAVIGFGFFGPAEPDIALVIKPGDEPILWSAGDFGGYQGDYTELFAVELSEAGAGSAVLPGPFPAGRYHLMLVNRDSDAFIQNATFTHTPAEVEEPDAGPAVDPPDAGGAPVDPPDDDDEDDGCACSVPGRSGPVRGLAVGLLALVGLALVRRRRA